MKVLTIGNSFTWSLRRYFPALCAFERKPLTIDFANFGGCELARHWSYIKAEKADPLCRIYPGGRLCDILGRESWDVVTIQQASHDSWREETYEPYAGNIISYVREFAPQAEIMVQQTWAYRADSGLFAKWGITQQEMHDKLTANYRALAGRYGLRVIPTGLAVAISRAAEPVPFRGYDPVLRETLRWPDLPPQSGDVVGTMKWVKDASSGEMTLQSDFIHLNIRGEYMQSCLWYAVLFGKKTSDIAFVPEDIGNSDAAFLREAAGRAMAEWA